MNDLPPMSTGHEPPHNLEAEQGLLGIILANNRAYERVAETLRPEHFYNPVHGRIYEACARLIDKGQTANPISLKEQFDADPALQEEGGAKYLVGLHSAFVTASNAREYAEMILALWQRRELVEISRACQAEACATDGALTIATIIGMFQNDLDEVSGINKDSGDLVQISGAARAVAERARRVSVEGPGASGISCGITDLDDRMGRLMGSRLYIFAGRPGMGKTQLAVNIAARVSKPVEDQEPQHVAFFSLEMKDEELASRLISMRTEISQTQQEEGPLDENDVQRIETAERDISLLNLHVDHTPGRNIRDIRSRCMRMKRKHGLALVVIDYLQLMSAVPSQRPENRTQEVSQITMALKALAKELDVPVIALSQLSRNVESRDDKRPILADLRESGSIEQDADVVLFLYREFYYLDRARPIQRERETSADHSDRVDAWEARLDACRNKLDAICAKRRSGSTGTVTLFANMANGRIGNFSRWGA